MVPPPDGGVPGRLSTSITTRCTVLCGELINFFVHDSPPFVDLAKLSLTACPSPLNRDQPTYTLCAHGSPEPPRIGSARMYGRSWNAPGELLLSSRIVYPMCFQLSPPASARSS